MEKGVGAIAPTEKQLSYEPTTGRCKKHGQCIIWVACKHVADGKARKIALIKPDIALCAHCAPRLKELDVDDFSAVCEGCLRDYIRKLAEAGKDVNECVIGLEHLGGRDKWN